MHYKLTDSCYQIIRETICADWLAWADMVGNLKFGYFE